MNKVLARGDLYLIQNYLKKTQYKIIQNII